MNPKEYMIASNDSQLERWMQSSGYYPWGTLPPSEDINEMRRRYEAAGKAWNYSWDEIQNFTGGTDWYDAVTRNGQIQDYNLSVSGSGKNPTISFHWDIWVMTELSRITITTGHQAASTSTRHSASISKEG